MKTTIIFISLSFFYFSSFAQKNVETIKLPYTQSYKTNSLWDDFHQLQNGIVALSTADIIKYCDSEYDESFSPDDSYYLVGTGKIDNGSIFYIYYHNEIWNGRESGGYKLSIRMANKITTHDFLLAFDGWSAALSESEQENSVRTSAQLKIKDEKLHVIVFTEPFSGKKSTNEYVYEKNEFVELN